uniref:BLTX225 n=1 Tax=Nephila pilipes TaxID=299642 RepID=A0A076L210_NEPPI|nr:BLTX225 [Nephila pilipes]
MAIVFLCCGTFFYLIITNLMGLIPFVFTSRAHPIITLGIGLVI